MIGEPSGPGKVHPLRPWPHPRKIPAEQVATVGESDAARSRMLAWAKASDDPRISAELWHWPLRDKWWPVAREYPAAPAGWMLDVPMWLYRPMTVRELRWERLRAWWRGLWGAD